MLEGDKSALTIRELPFYVIKEMSAEQKYAVRFLYRVSWSLKEDIFIVVLRYFIRVTGSGTVELSVLHCRNRGLSQYFLNRLYEIFRGTFFNQV